ncbi:MAG: TIGR02597 family protein [Chloroflexota bacterium]
MKLRISGLAGHETGWRIMIGATLLLCPCHAIQAASSDVGQVGGIHRLILTAGPNFISAPLHHAPAFRGTVSSVAAGAVTLSGTPGWSANQFGPHDGFAQYIALLRNTASATPGNQGDWWPVQANTANTLTLKTGGEDLTTVVGAGDELEIRRLISLQDIFGTGTSLRLFKDSNGSASAKDEDVIYLVSGTSFSSEVFYHDGSLAPEGYYVDGNGPFDGSTITIGPDEPIMIFRKTSAPTLNFFAVGQVQATRLTHYLKFGPNPVATGYPVVSPIGSSDLLESGWKADSDGSANPKDEDLLYAVTGSSFSDEIFYHDGTLVAPGWYVNGVQNDAFPLDSAKGLFLFVQNPLGLRWRESVPF